ncbi:adenosylcobinamide amidohydrolase [Alkalibacter mobilis]|uniref:adenosylcobinamide amidohydrolase n=1 Tax=Alkalibacter mobilis TaxID=2787712 RepID=UPI00189E071F|nr:adenosylcobinamide amidohydrolase [Alkalibacter mobilis]MBF7095649.1 adenosylcobinamide amidohydrolase [Alkalibacter mobilis]
MIYQLETGDKIHRYNRCLVAKFSGKRRVLSTSSHNGGYREDLSAIFNRDVNPGVGKLSEYCKSSEEEKKKFIIDELGLDYTSVAYMATIVSMDHAAIKTLKYDTLSVTAIATASLEVNGGRVGEEATCYENCGENVPLKPGTINIMVFCNRDMTCECMARSIMTSTEAKVAALQELMASSLRSSGIATGSGTDNIMIIANADSNDKLTYAGKHGKLGELIGRTVMDAVTESLEKHMNLSANSQHSVLSRTKRYGIDEKSLIEKIEVICPSLDISDVLHLVHTKDRNGVLVGLTSLYIHLMDQLKWGLISGKTASQCGEILLNQISTCLSNETIPENVFSENINSMAELFTACFADAVVCNLTNTNNLNQGDVTR